MLLLDQLRIQLIDFGGHFFDQAHANLWLMIDQLNKLFFPYDKYCAVAGRNDRGNSRLAGEDGESTEDFICVDFAYFDSIANCICAAFQ